MSGASMFWRDVLHGCQLDRLLPLPYDRHRLTNEHRTGRTALISFDLDENISHDLFTCASYNGISLRQLTLALYYIFLFKVTDGERDLCVGMNINNRYRSELKTIIGLFDNIIPLRCHFNPNLSFQQHLQKISDMERSSMEFSYLPLDRIFDQHPGSSSSFLSVCFDFGSNQNGISQNDLMVGVTSLRPLFGLNNESEYKISNQFDFTISIKHDIITDQLSCAIYTSVDLFSKASMETMANRFLHMVQSACDITNSLATRAINELSTALPTEQLLMQSVNNTATQTSFPTCLHHDFVQRVTEYPQKLAVELDEQSLTYSELLHYGQLLSLHLMNEYGVTRGETICQCIERSISTVVGLVAVEFVGGIYCPLSPRDPRQRLQALLQQTNSRIVLVHHSTKQKFNDDIISPDIDLIFTQTHSSDETHVGRLSNVIVSPNHVAYIVFTSGSTGIPKAVCFSATYCLRPFSFVHFRHKYDTGTLVVV
ncbi:unnamed protein product [Adineta ricciae]|uniref:Uncharacterized protein n=1 Tax=Adineta ricciae TaxID=249248 RepID=A0A816GYC0_ADIRI|nr:unnamed protein product [Adineta ricciae]